VVVTWIDHINVLGRTQMEDQDQDHNNYHSIDRSCQYQDYMFMEFIPIFRHTEEGTEGILVFWRVHRLSWSWRWMLIGGGRVGRDVK